MNGVTTERVISSTESFICTLCGAFVLLHTSNINDLHIVDRHTGSDGLNDCESSGKNYTGERSQLPASSRLSLPAGVALTAESAERFLKENRSALGREFGRQYPDLNVGGFYNPTVVSVSGAVIEFSCHYNGFEREEDAWTWFYDANAREFYN